MFWMKNGVILAENGHLINCNTCPCQIVCPCGNWYTQTPTGYQVLYSVDISFYVSKWVKWYQDYGEGEEERYQNLQQIDATAYLTNVPISDILHGFCFYVNSSIYASDRWEYKYYSGNSLVSDDITENSLDTSRCDGCPTDDPEEAPADDNTHGLTFTCNNNCENFRFGISTTAFSCHGTHYEESLWGADQWEMPVQVGVNVNHLVFPSRNPNLTFREIPGKGYVLQGDTLELSYQNGNPDDDIFTQQRYRHVLTFTPQLD